MEPRLHPSRAHGMVSEMARQTEAVSALGRNVAGFFRSGSRTVARRLASPAWGRCARARRAGRLSRLASLARLVDGQLLDPLVAARWLGAAALTAGLIALRRRGVSLVTGRRALVVWLLVVFLHWSAKPAVTVADDGQPSTSDLIFVVPSTAAAALVGLGLLVATFAASRVRRPALACLCTVEPSDAGRTASGWRPSAAARAPPFRFV